MWAAWCAFGKGGARGTPHLRAADSERVMRRTKCTSGPCLLRGIRTLQLTEFKHVVGLFSEIAPYLVRWGVYGRRVGGFGCAFEDMGHVKNVRDPNA